MGITWMSHGYHMNVTWVSHVYHGDVTYLSHGLSWMDGSVNVRAAAFYESAMFNIAFYLSASKYTYVTCVLRHH